MAQLLNRSHLFGVTILGFVVIFPLSLCAKLTIGQISPSSHSGKVESSRANNEEPKYVLAFAPNYRGRIKWKFGEYNRIVESERTSFVKKLNEFGRGGYRSVSSLIHIPVAILQIDEGFHEYALFETSSTLHFVKSGLADRLKGLVISGSLIVDHAPISQSCEPLDPEDASFGEKCTYKDLFLVETEHEATDRKEQALSRSFPGWGSQPSEEMTSEINNLLFEGFYPVRAISKYEILLERGRKNKALDDEKPDVRVVRAGWAKDDLPNKINDLARNGYRLALTANGVGVLYKNEKTATSPVSYSFIRADKKKFENEIRKMQERGARYITTYPNAAGTRNTLVFEVPFEREVVKSEFRILNIDFKLIENAEEGIVYRYLTDASSTSLLQMNELAKGGFVVRDLFESGSIGVLMEKQK